MSKLETVPEELCEFIEKDIENFNFDEAVEYLEEKDNVLIYFAYLRESLYESSNSLTGRDSERFKLAAEACGHFDLEKAIEELSSI